jgi:SAM-dependent methyltransferase
MSTWAAGLRKQGRYYWSRALTRIGERIGSERLTYNALVHEHFAGQARERAPAMARIIRRALPEIRTAVDLGCGSGHFVAALRAEGIQAEGYEYAPRLRRIAAQELGITLHPFDIAAPQAVRSVDLAISIEVAEHLPPALGDSLVKVLTEAAPLIWFTAAQPGQGGTGHVNEQAPAYWISRFRALGYEFDSDTSDALRPDLACEIPSAPWLARNLLVLRRRAAN